MKVLVIPDIHLKPWMFRQAERLMEEGAAGQAVCLMDIPDDWGKEFHLELYRETFDAAISFARRYPETLWAYGNHDLCYLWDKREGGYSGAAAWLVREKLAELEQALPEGNEIRYVQQIDHVLFCHGGILDSFVRKNVHPSAADDVEKTVRAINQLTAEQIWQNDSPVWHRPQYTAGQMYKPRQILQVTGHTPAERIYREGNVLSCDVFSTYRNGTPVGTQEYLLLDTKNWEFEGRKG